MRCLLLGFCVLVAPLPGLAVTEAPGTIQLHVDLRKAPERMISVQEVIPVKPGLLTLLYPKWVPGADRAPGAIANIAGLIIRAGDQQLHWRRDLHDPYSIHLQVPSGVDSLSLSFQFLPPKRHGKGVAGPSTTPDLAILEFSQVIFHPAGQSVHHTPVQARVTLPTGWRYASALHSASTTGHTVQFREISLAQLVDSPLLCGQHLLSTDLGQVHNAPARIHIAADLGVNAQLDEPQIRGLRRLHHQVRALFGHAPYHHYDFLLTLSDHVGYYTLEHRQSSDNRLPADFLTEPAAYRLLVSLLSHEWVHAWNGKYRQPKDAMTHGFREAPASDLAWVYEGLTDYWAAVLNVRSGLWTPEYFHAVLASTHHLLAHRTGRSWRNLQDTADAARLNWEGSKGWRNWRRGGDYHAEGLLLWLDVDTRIREHSNNQRSLDDFARQFFGSARPDKPVQTYDFEQLVAALHAIEPLDWTSFLRKRLDYTGTGMPYHGLERSGWQTRYGDQPNARDSDLRKLDWGLDLRASLGLSVNQEGRVRDVQWQGPASAAGLVPGMQLVAVNGQSFTSERLLQAIREASQNAQPIQLWSRDTGVYKKVAVDYHGGLRFPVLQRVDGQPDLLADIIRPLDSGEHHP